ncbi:hypothetical protein GYMLUDRAFT_44553 [Collybiopsis luxurians FD-317 M1]|uniref:Uncharacterized protein n=1 Tax=Collybiopsis luxurians FD-317 M1 TaxID=944289 RepID=A0A0D0CLX4_9AGAR|nr:hypothetical protein GYMLUDRAFT_44553 [Collybiopsis luxurians FD-317 M1]
MFEEICLTCGKHLSDDGRVYCSDECKYLDTASPSISSASSALSSPHLGYAQGLEVPPLPPSAISSALRGYHTRDHHSVSSSASSTSCSILTDEDDEDAHFVSGSEGGYHDDNVDSSTKSSGLYPVLRAPLSYARRPSGTNNGHAAPRNIGRPPTSRSFPGHVYSAPVIHSHSHSQSSTDDENFSDFGSSSRDEVEPYSPLTTPEDEDERKSTITKTKRTRNRASLPAYFSLLQVSPPRISLSVSDSSGQSVARPSPPTPKVSNARMPNHPFTAPLTATMQATPRGRRRDLDASRASRMSRDSVSSSRSRSRSYHPFAPPTTAAEAFRSQLSSNGSKSSMEKVFDWTAVSAIPRGRTAIRRNSSPPPKMIFPDMNSEQFNFPPRGRKADSTSRPRPRGRVMVSELDGMGGTREAPGYGHGRSGLIHREQAFLQRLSGGKPSS